MILVVFDFTQHIEQEYTHILMQILMVQEQLRQKGQVFTVNWIFVAVDLENCNLAFFVTVDLVTWRVEQWAYL